MLELTAAQLLRDMRAQHEARRTYRTRADWLWAEAQTAFLGGWFGWAKELWRMALMVENAAWAEDVNP